MWLWVLLLLPEINSITDGCTNICDHDDVNVCCVRTDGFEEVSFRLFRDQCSWRKFECETGIKDFRPTRMEHCNQVLSLNTNQSSNSEEHFSDTEETQTKYTEVSTSNLNNFNITNISTNTECNVCELSNKFNLICAIRAEGEKFIIRWFPDECHMFQHNCENNLNFTVTDDYICRRDKDYPAKETDTTEPTKGFIDTENNNQFYDTDENFQNQTCIKQDCTSNDKVICAIRPAGERFIVRLFNDKCHMLQYNCEKQVNFTVIDTFICDGDDDDTSSEETDANITSKLKEKNDKMTETTETTAFSKTLAPIKESYNPDYGSNMPKLFPKNVVVSTFDINDSINQTVKKFFAASHTTGIQLQKLGDEQSRRMIVKDTGPINIFVPRTFIPANYTPAENESLDRPEYSPLIKYCYHKCPQKCPDFYKPVCGARNEITKQTPYLFFKNHCYLDIAKCQMHWAGYKGINLAALEEAGFIFCGGYKTMNMWYMYPLIRILQKMGRLQKKGKVHFEMRNLGQFPFPLKG